MFSPSIQKLIRRRAELQQEIEREQGALSPDWPRVHHLKKWRLALKDALQRMAFSAPLALPYGPAPGLIPAPVSPPPRPARQRPSNPDRRPARQNA